MAMFISIIEIVLGAAALLGTQIKKTAWLLLLMILFFTFFYTAITFNPIEVSDNLQKFGGFIPGIRPGKNTAEYLVISRRD